MGVEAGLMCMLEDGVSICGAGCDGEGVVVVGFCNPECGIRLGKCSSLVAAGGLTWLIGAETLVASSELRAGIALLVPGLSAGAPLQWEVLCLRNMAERVKLFPQALQMYGFSPVCERM